jgi:hypothetical protein
LNLKQTFSDIATNVFWGSKYIIVIKGQRVVIRVNDRNVKFYVNPSSGTLQWGSVVPGRRERRYVATNSRFLATLPQAIKTEI